MKASDKSNLILAGAGVLIALYALSGKGKGDGGEGGGGLALPSFIPVTSGAETAGGVTNYYISFPDTPSFPDAVTKKEASIATVPVITRTSGGFGYTYQTVQTFPGLGTPSTLAQGILNTSPSMMTPEPKNPAAWKPASVWQPAGGGGSSKKSSSSFSFGGSGRSSSKSGFGGSW